jgi:hypothetical protein
MEASVSFENWRDEETRVRVIDYVCFIDNLPRLQALTTLEKLDEADLDRTWRDMLAALFRAGRLGDDTRRGIESYMLAKGVSLETAIAELDALGDAGRRQWVKDRLLH